MIQSVKNRPISQLFDIEMAVIYKVPRYQREYTWSKWHWEKLFDDLLSNNLGYFLGSIICINQSDDALATQELEIVDGQQRLTTLLLLLGALYNYLYEHIEELDEDKRVELVNLKRKIILKKNVNQTRVVPQIQNNNRQDFEAILANAKILPDHFQMPKNAGNRRIVRAYRYFWDRVDKIVEENDSSLSVVFDFLDKVNTAAIVKIEVSNHSDAYVLFESLNNRGVPLSAIDLLKNKLLAQLEKVDPGKIDDHFNHWTQLIEKLTDDYSVQERFFRHYYNAFRSDFNPPIKPVIATRSNLIHIYEKLIEHDPKSFLNEITNSGSYYSQIIAENENGTDEEIFHPLENLSRIQGAPSYLLLLHLLKEKANLEIENSQLKNLINFLVKFFVRRNLTDIPATRKLNSIFMDIIESIGNEKGEKLIRSIISQLIDVSASDESFETSLGGQIYTDNAGVVRFILCYLEEENMTKESWVNLWKMEKKRYVWTIEHIFPQGENIPPSWVEMIAGGNEQKAIELRESHVHKLGNLTISGFNSTLGNKSFKEKRDRRDRKGRYVGYLNGLHLNKDLADRNSWKTSDIDDRTATLKEIVLELFKLR